MFLWEPGIPCIPRKTLHYSHKSLFCLPRSSWCSYFPSTWSRGICWIIGNENTKEYSREANCPIKSSHTLALAKCEDLFVFICAYRYVFYVYMWVFCIYVCLASIYNRPINVYVCAREKRKEQRSSSVCPLLTRSSFRQEKMLQPSQGSCSMN